MSKKIVQTFAIGGDPFCPIENIPDTKKKKKKVTIVIIKRYKINKMRVKRDYRIFKNQRSWLSEKS
jgi:hypothetical protein